MPRRYICLPHRNNSVLCSLWRLSYYLLHLWFTWLSGLARRQNSLRLGMPVWSSLIVLVLIIPYFTKEPWFSKLCPVGTLEAGIPQVLYNADLRQLVGRLFFIKIVILSVYLLWMIASKRPFCRTTCPLGAIYSLFNKVSFLRIQVDKNRCIQCNKCYKSCPVSIKIHEEGGASLKCIRCMRCTDCPTEAVSYKLKFKL
ncbi:MAG: iron-sulfur cluster-binding protein [Firmicutes bacterium]|nr:iron-sulfur cluster-binding protein [Bacillota bacterium]